MVSRPLKAADQHEQSRARQMEIGEHHVDGPEFVAGRDENRGLAGKGVQPAVVTRRAFRSRKRGRANGDDPPPLARAALSAPAASDETLPNSACILWPAVSSALTGRKVPAPTCRVTFAGRCRAR